MSIIWDLKPDLSNLVSVIERFEKPLTGVADQLRIQGKLLEKANLEQASHMAYYDQLRIDLSSIVKKLEAHVQQVRGKLWIQYTERYSISLQARDKDHYINQESAYLNANELLIVVQELYKKYEAVVEAFKMRGYALNNITKMRVAALEDVMM